jgi:hypothetical protein
LRQGYSYLSRLIEKLRKKWIELTNGITAGLSQDRK